jgi:hypothetical protein
LGRAEVLVGLVPKDLIFGGARLRLYVEAQDEGGPILSDLLEVKVAG